jgi:signal transducing adaptor molecule
MFKGGQSNPYDDIVNKTTDENLTGENWELILNLCDKVQDEGEQGARNVIAAVLKRLAHRNPNVQLYALSLAESLSKNCGVELHRELASRAFTQALEKIITDRTTHDKVKKRALALIAQWTAEFEKDPTLGIMEECYNTLKAKNFKFEIPQEAAPPTVDDEVRRREEEELQRVLEMSVQDKGGRGQWTGYSAAASSSGTGASGSSANLGRKPSASALHTTSSTSRKTNSYAAPAASSGYVPAHTPSPKSQSPVQAPSVATPAATPVSAPEVPAASQEPTQGAIPIVTRVRALHTFEPTEPGELAFEKGDVIKVVDRGYKDWWRGQLKGRTGIFPVNYVVSIVYLLVQLTQPFNPHCNL